MTRLLRSLITARPSKTSSTKELRDLIDNGRTSAQLAPCHRINFGPPLQIRRSEQPHLCEKPSLSTRIFPNSPTTRRRLPHQLFSLSAFISFAIAISLIRLIKGRKGIRQFPSTGMKRPDAFVKGQDFTPVVATGVSSFAGQALRPLLLLSFFTWTTCALRLLTVRHLSPHAAHGYPVRI